MTKILLDTNILVSAALFKENVPALAYAKAITPPNFAVVCDYSIEELKRVFNRKFPHKVRDYESFMSIMALAITIVPSPLTEEREEESIRDINDRPILRAAIAANVDILITGDKDFLESGIKTPTIITPSKFLELT